MKKSKWRILPLTTAILSGLRLALEGAVRLAARLNGQIRLNHGKSASVGIIGGADGPTAIFITGSTDTPALVLAAVVFVVSVFVYIYLRKKQLQNRQ